MSLSQERSLSQLSNSVGDFMRYWGFRRIHGQIWTQVFLSKEHLSGADLTERLAVSKALVSPALTELEAHGLIEVIPDGKKTKRYRAAPNVIEVIKSVLKEREARLLAESKRQFEKLETAHLKAGAAASILEPERVQELGQMIDVANYALLFLVGELEKPELDKWVP